MAHSAPVKSAASAATTKNFLISILLKSPRVSRGFHTL